MMGLGILWAVFAPAFLILPAWIFVKMFRLRWRTALLIVSVATLSVWLPQRIAFSKRCEGLGEPTIFKTVSVDGFFLDDPTANSFGMRYLEKPGFSWLEAKSIYHRDKFTRYEKVGGKIEQREIDKPTARFVLRSSLNVEGPSQVDEVTISKLETGEVLARARSATFDGGHAKWVLGVYGTASCPNPNTEEGSRAFRKMYDLAWETLRVDFKSGHK